MILGMEYFVFILFFFLRFTSLVKVFFVVLVFYCVLLLFVYFVFTISIIKTIKNKSNKAIMWHSYDNCDTLQWPQLTSCMSLPQLLFYTKTLSLRVDYPIRQHPQSSMAHRCRHLTWQNKTVLLLAYMKSDRSSKQTFHAAAAVSDSMTPSVCH